ncbi:MAG: hypothetical protein IKD43_03180 [Clostridia bacterium]|nr:hypothetical protein [Clostridia bacterium]
MRRFHYFLRGRLFPCALLFLLIVAGIAALAIWLPRLLAPVAILERAFSLSVAIAVISADEPCETKIAKLTLLFLPWMGAALCIFFRAPARRSAPSVFFEEGKQEAFHSSGSPDFGHGALIKRVAALSKRLSGLFFAHADSVQYFPVGHEMYARFRCDLKAAKHRIFLEYYIIAQGSFWGDILEILTEKAKAGVDVRVIYDDFGCSFTLPEDYCNELKRRNVKAAIYRPVKVGRGFGRRDHRKLAVIDGVAYTGGINLADEYVGKLLRFGHWKDSAIRLEGDVSAFSKLFLQTWYALNPFEKTSLGDFHVSLPKEQSARASEIASLRHEFLSSTQASTVPYVPVADWANAAQRTFPKLLPLVAAHARSRLWMFTPYLSLPREAEEALRSAALSGVDVRIMIPHVPDKKTVFFLTRAYARRLERAGVRIREYAPGFLHAKSFSVDGQYAFVSSYNLDFRSLFVQAECGAFFESKELAEMLERDFESAWRQGMPVKRVGKFQEFVSHACMLFAPLT